MNPAKIKIQEVLTFLKDYAPLNCACCSKLIGVKDRVTNKMFCVLSKDADPCRIYMATELCLGQEALHHGTRPTFENVSNAILESYHDLMKNKESPHLKSILKDRMRDLEGRVIKKVRFQSN